jgi:hypothetical protein
MKASESEIAEMDELKAELRKTASNPNPAKVERLHELIAETGYVEDIGPIDD